MAIPIKKLVSLILEQINTKAELDRLFPPDKDVYVDDLSKYPILFQEISATGDEPRGIERRLEPDVADDKVRTLSREPELQMVAEMARQMAGTEQINEPIRINAADIVVAPGTKAPGKIITKDPITGEMVEDVVVSNIVKTLNSGKKALVFMNYGESAGRDQSSPSRYIILSESRYMHSEPRGVIHGKPVDRSPHEKFFAIINNPNSTEEQIAAAQEKIYTIKEANAKRYIIFPLVNKMFADPELLDIMDVSLIPETWATPLRTERTSNVLRELKFGGDNSEIDTEFVSVRDFEDLNKAIDDVMNLRADLALGAVSKEDRLKNRSDSEAAPRRFANKIYHNGNWFAHYRSHDKEFFKREGGKTRVYELFSKNIQEGGKALTIESRLKIKGFIAYNEYVLVSIFTATMSVRNPQTGEGQNVGEIIPAVRTTLKKPIVDEEGNMMDTTNFTISNNPTFFVDEGFTQGPKTGFFADFMEKTGDNIKNSLDPDEVFNTMNNIILNITDNKIEGV